MNVDFHLHSTRSDGLLEPSAVVDLAADAGVEMLVLTDHDTVAGVAEARAQSGRRGTHYIAGVEISAEWNGQTLHIIGLDVDTDSPALLAGLQTVREMRRERLRHIARRLERNE